MTNISTAAYEPTYLPPVRRIDNAPGIIGEQPLLWDQWGGAIAIGAVLAALIIGLTLTVGAIPTDAYG